MTVFLQGVCGVLSLLLVFVSAAHAENFVDNKDGTVFDARSSLMWQQEDDGTERIWDDAVKYCEDLELAGYSDWVLPKIFELEGLIDVGQSPTISPLFSVKPSYYWSSTESRTSVSSAKYVNFFYGNTYTYSKDNTYYALCVRDASKDKVAPLVADFKYGRGEEDSTVQFTAMISGGSEPFFHEWDFGDGDTSSLIAPSHSFSGPGTYTIKLTVSDSDGSIAVSSQTILLPLIDDVPGPAEDELVGIKEGHEGQDAVSPAEPEEGAERTMSQEESGIGAVEDGDAIVLNPADLLATENGVVAEVLEAEHPAPMSTGVVVEDLAAEKEQEVMPEGVQPEAELMTASAAGAGTIAVETTLSEETDLSGSDTATAGQEAPLGEGNEADGEVLSEQDSTASVEETKNMEGGTLAATAPPSELLEEEIPATATAVTATAVTATAVTAPGEPVPAEVEQGDSAREVDVESVPPVSLSVLQIFAGKESATFDPGIWGHRLLAYAFSNALRGDADLNKDSKVTASELKGYLGIAMESLSEGSQKPVISLDGESFTLCSDQHSTYTFVIGANSFAQGTDLVPYALESAELVRKSIEDHCQQVKTISLSAEHASRQEVLQALMQIKNLIEPGDRLVFYFAGKSDVDSAGRLVLSLFDTVPEMASLTGLHYEDVLDFIRTMNTTQIILLLETATPF